MGAKPRQARARGSAPVDKEEPAGDDKAARGPWESAAGDARGRAGSLLQQPGLRALRRAPSALGGAPVGRARGVPGVPRGAGRPRRAAAAAPASGGTARGFESRRPDAREQSSPSPREGRTAALATPRSVRSSTSRSSAGPAPTGPTTTSCCPPAITRPSTSTRRWSRPSPPSPRVWGRDRQAFRPVAGRRRAVHRPRCADPRSRRGRGLAQPPAPGLRDQGGGGADGAAAAGHAARRVRPVHRARGRRS